MGRPPKHVLKSGRPVMRAGERRLDSIDATGKVHPLVTLDEACGIISGSKDLVAQLTNAGVIRVATAASQTGHRLYSRLDLEAVANQLYGDGASAEVAVGLKPAPAAEQK